MSSRVIPRDPVVTDVDVGMVIHLFGQLPDRRDECQRPHEAAAGHHLDQLSAHQLPSRTIGRSQRGLDLSIAEDGLFHRAASFPYRELESRVTQRSSCTPGPH
jgi:hypothetical protein